MTNSSPLVSVVMITYGHEQFIREAIESVLNQNFEGSMELIVADDCSPDKTEDIVHEIIDQHPKGNCVFYYKHSSNKGMINNFIWALEQARGEYIALCEGDDYWTSKNKIIEQYELLQKNPELILSVHDTEEKDAFDNSIKRSERLGLFDLEPKDQFISLKTILKKDILFFHTSSFFFTNGKLNYNLLSPFHSGDIPLLYLLASKGKVHYSLKCNSVYRHHEGGITKSEERKRNYHFNNREMYKNLKLVLDEEYHSQLRNIIYQDLSRENISLLKTRNGIQKLIPFTRLILWKRHHNYSIRDLFYILRH